MEAVPKNFNKSTNKSAKKNSLPLKVVLAGLQRDAEINQKYRNNLGLNA